MNPILAAMHARMTGLGVGGAVHPAVVGAAIGGRLNPMQLAMIKHARARGMRMGGGMPHMGMPAAPMGGGMSLGSGAVGGMSNPMGGMGQPTQMGGGSPFGGAGY